MATEVSPGVTALGRIPSGLFIVTAASGGQETGMLASWVQQCSFEPPLVSVAVKHGRYLLEWLATGAPLTVNVIPEGEKRFVKHYGQGFEPGEAAFEGIDVERTAGFAPSLTEAVANIQCRVHSQAPAGDHVLVLAEVVGGTVRMPARPAVHVRNNGAHY